MRIIIILTFFLTFGFVQRIVAQNNNRENGLTQIATCNFESGWYIFNKGVTPTAESMNDADMKKYVGFDTDNSFLLIRSFTDELKIKHDVFQQMYKGYPIQFATFKLHKFSDKPIEANGNFIPDFTKPTSSIISFSQALDFAKQYFPAKKYMWEDSLQEASYKRRKHNQAITYYPKQELIWANSSKNLNDLNVANYSLAYKMIICGYHPSFSKEVYIDASSGKLLNVFELDETTCYSYPFTSNFNGTQAFVSQNFNLIDDCTNPDEIYTTDNGLQYSNNTGSWASTNDLNSAATSMFALRRANTYYYYVHLRNGWDNGSPSQVDIYQNADFPGGSNSNAQFSYPAGICRVGNNETTGPHQPNSMVSDDWNSLDIIAHELTHGVTFSSPGAMLAYQGESGALNESFSDIFGVNVYQYWGGYSPGNLWKHGYDRTNASGVHLYGRNMADPHDVGAQFGVQPDTYLTDPSWVNTASAYDNGGIHYNSGVQNKMYYLLVEGGTGTNSNGLTYNITGIGFNDARVIAYRALVLGYLNPNSNHVQARSAWVHSAIDIFGSCSVQSQTVGQAWEAVGVPSPNSGNTICGSYSGPQSLVSYSPYLISGTGCTTTILGTGNQVSFNGGSYVNISPGFNTNTGAFFTVTTNGCYYSDY